MRRALARAVGRARGRAYGRERARRRLQSGRWDPHPGWRNRVDPGVVILTDQIAALARVEQLVDAEDWRGDKRRRWTAMLRRLVHSMDWSTGLICGLTLAQLATAGDCSARTVSRLLAWAQEVDLVVVVEVGAAAAFLGTDRNRAPAYVLTAPPAPPDEHIDEPGRGEGGDEVMFSQFSEPVDESGDLPHVAAGSNPLTNGYKSRPTRWPLWQIPTTPAERNAAVHTLLHRIGLGSALVPVWRARALLAQWWADGACVAGVLWMLDHHPDHPDQGRGDALRGAVDPLRVLGYRLRPWVGQLHRLPPDRAGRRGDYRNQQAAQVDRRIAAAEHRCPAADPKRTPLSTAAAREAARAALEAILADRARRRPSRAAPSPGNSYVEDY